ncbi:uncharacterized protein LOC125258652 [Megalobrama amblycephala]|uniref:uncharacterized protein LOC125258652 n=1 Tax=Megalobrama amblycephala TaxID=75352 RepID=UPI002013E5E7|nr:uncharacterized protein LOC125258652 [Megalobrama amblycephala]
MAQQLRDSCRKWLLADGSDLEQVIDRVVLEQFITRLPKKTAKWVHCHRPTLLDSAIQLAEDHMVACPGPTLCHKSGGQVWAGLLALRGPGPFCGQVSGYGSGDDDLGPRRPAGCPWSSWLVPNTYASWNKNLLGKDVRVQVGETDQGPVSTASREQSGIGRLILSDHDDIPLEQRREVVEDQPLVSTLKQRWPALFNEEQVYAEFRRINHLDLKSTFLTSLDNNSRGLLKLFRAKVIQRGDCDLETLLDNLDEQMADLTVQRRATALRGLPFYFKEHGTICKTILSSEALEHHKVGMKMGILEVVSSNSSTSRSLSDVVNVAIVLEEEVVLENMGDFVSAFIVLFGMLYALNMEYNKDLRYTFEFIQKVFLNMGTECSKKVQTLMSKLLEN